MVSERVKQISQNKDSRSFYFWRTMQQQEIDFVEEVNGKFFAYEFKWNVNKKVSFSKTFTNNYESVNKAINRRNFREFVFLPNTLR